MSPVCCPRCRLLQPPSTACRQCGTEDPIAPARLTRSRVEGVTAMTKQPPTGWRDRLALWSTALGIFGGVVAGFLLLPPWGFLLGPAAGVFGYTKQYWKTAFLRRQRLRPTELPRSLSPHSIPHVGIAQPFEKTIVSAAKSTDEPILVVATTLCVETEVPNENMLVRTVDAVPFWLVIGERRILIIGEVWADEKPAVIVNNADDATMRAVRVSDLPLTRAHKRALAIARCTIAAGDEIAVHGSAEAEQLAGAGYRDTHVEAMRGVAGSIVWIEKVAIQFTS